MRISDWSSDVCSSDLTVSHLAFVPIVRSMFDGTIVLAGAVSTGAVLRAAQLLGADLAYIGTRFIATQAALAPEDNKTLLVEGGVTDVIYKSPVKGMRSQEHTTELPSPMRTSNRDSC